MDPGLGEKCRAGAGPASSPGAGPASSQESDGPGGARIGFEPETGIGRHALGGAGYVSLRARFAATVTGHPIWAMRAASKSRQHAVNKGDQRVTNDWPITL